MPLPTFTVQVLADGTCLINGNRTATDATSLWAAVHSAPAGRATFASPNFKTGRVESVDEFKARGGRVSDFTSKGMSLESLGL